MARRRKFLAGLGALASGSAAAVGTGAFTSTQADRDVTVAVADDASAYLGLEPAGSANSNAYVSVGGKGQVSLDLSDSGNGGSGLNKNAETRIDDLLVVSNQGTQTVNVWVDIGLGDVSGISNSDLYFFPGDATDTRLNNGAGSETDEVLALTPGESATLGLFADIGDISSVSTTVTAEVNANVSRGDAGASEPVDDSGGSFSIVANDGSGDFSDLQTAIDNASGTTIVVKDTGTPLDIPAQLTIPANKSGLELRGLNGKPTLSYTGGYPGGGDGIVSQAPDATIRDLRFEFNGNVDDDSLENFSGGNQLFAIEGDNTTLSNVDIIGDNSNFEAPLSFLDTSSASGVRIENSLFDVVDASGNTVNGAGSGQNFIGARFLNNNTFRGNARIATQSQESATIKNNTIEGLGFTEGIAIDGSATNVLIEGNSINYDSTDVSESFNGAEIRVEPNAADLKLNGSVRTDAAALAEAISTANSGTVDSQGAVTVVRSTDPNTYFPSSFAPSSSGQ